MSDQDTDAEERAILDAIAAGNSAFRDLAERIDRFPDPVRAYELADKLAEAAVQRRGDAAALRARQVRRIKDTPGMTMSAVGDRIGKTKQRVNRMLKSLEQGDTGE